MIEEAEARSHGVGNLRYMNLSVEQFARDNAVRFDLCIAGMTLMTMPNLQECLEAIRNLTKENGRFIFSIPHPCFWNGYRHDEPEEAFDYWKEHSVTAPFRISLDRRPLPTPTTYYHRSLQQYARALTQARFSLVDLVEPEVPATAPAEYRQSYRLPRFIVVAARPAS
jgi:SAM-dependent methyltransferase